MKFNRVTSFILNATLTVVGLNLYQFPVSAQKRAEQNETIVSGQTAMASVAYGELIRFRAFNPSQTDSGEANESISLQLKVFDQHGALLVESPTVVIPPGEFRWVDINREDLKIPGDPGTSRAEVRTTALWSVSGSRRIRVPTSLDLVDRNTGASTFRFLYIVETLP